MTVGFREQVGPASVPDVQRLEQRAGQPLPGEYRAYVLSVGGGYLLDNSKAVKLIFGVRDDAPDWARIADKLDTFHGRVPDWLLPAAQDEYGNLYLVSLRNGAVWFWDHEQEADEGEPPTTANLDQVADSWSQFLNGIQPA